MHVITELLRRPVYEGIRRKAAALRRASLGRAAAQSGSVGGDAPQVGDKRSFQTRSVLEGKTRVEEAAATIAHEYQHLIHARYIHARYEGERRERTFVNEGLSEAVEILCGFPPRPAAAYFRRPGRALLSWNYADPLPDYARASLFVDYLFERIGFAHLDALVQSPEVGREGIEAVLRAAGGPSFETLFRDWGRAQAY